MSTDELERLERRLEAALHEADDQPVDVPAGRAPLGERVGRQQQLVRRWTLAGVAASVLAVIVTTSLLVTGLRDEHEGLPVAPPGVTLSPSGLPVGVLEGRVDRTEPGVESTLSMVVRADGTGIYNAGTTGGVSGPSVADYPVTFVPDGPGRVVIRGLGECYSTDAMTLTFTVRGRTVRIEEALSNACDVNTGLADDLAGTTLRISPLPELSPSGLPVGLLEGQVDRSRGDTTVSTFRLRVRPDGTGTLGGGGGTCCLGRGAGAGYEVELSRLGPGRVAVSYDGPICSSPRAVSLTFRLSGRSVTIDSVEARGCLLGEQLASDLPGTVLRVLPLTPDGA
jgi:hypothetical protein